MMKKKSEREVLALSRKWLEKEASKWAEKGIISPAQRGLILEEYPERKLAQKTLPILASVLVGLGALSFVAANWQGIPSFLKLLLLMLITGGFYLFGERAHRKGSETMGAALAGIGVLSFGASIFLTSQMFHLASQSAMALVVWGIAAGGAAYLMGNRYLFLLALCILCAAQGVSVGEFREPSWTALAVFALLGFRWWKSGSALLSFGYSAAALFQIAMVYPDGMKSQWGWIVGAFAAVYALSQWAKNRPGGEWAQVPPLAAGYAATLVGVFEFSRRGGWSGSYDYGNPALVILFLAVACAAAAWAKKRNGETRSALDSLLFLPLFFLDGRGGDILCVLALVGYSLSLLWAGYAENSKLKINFGIVLFLFGVVIAYTHLAWDFMPKSLFFLAGGGILFGANWLLQKKKKEALSERGDES